MYDVLSTRVSRYFQLPAIDHPTPSLLVQQRLSPFIHSVLSVSRPALHMLNT